MTRLPARTKGPVRTDGTGGASWTDARSRNRSNPGTEDVLGEVPAAALKLLRFPAVRERTGLSRSTVWRLERQGAFPRHHRISANAVAWVEDDIAKWIQSKVAGIAV